MKNMYKGVRKDVGLRRKEKLDKGKGQKGRVKKDKKE